MCTYEINNVVELYVKPLYNQLYSKQDFKIYMDVHVCYMYMSGYCQCKYISNFYYFTQVHCISTQ